MKSAAIYGQNGALRARSDCFPNVTDDQIRAIMDGFNDVNVFAANGLWLGSERFVVIQNVPGFVIRGRNKQEDNRRLGGCCIHKTFANIVIAIYQDPSLVGDVDMVVAKVAKILIMKDAVVKQVMVSPDCSLRIAAFHVASTGTLAVIGS